MAAQKPQEKGGRASAQAGHGNVSAAEVEKFIKGIHFPTDKSHLIDHARKHGAPEEVISLMKRFPEHDYSSAVDVARGVKDAK